MSTVVAFRRFKYYFLLLMSIPVLGLCLYVFVKQVSNNIQLKIHGELSTAQITGLFGYSGRRSDACYHIYYTFISDGKKFTGDSCVLYGLWRQAKIGHYVDIFFLKNNPSINEIKYSAELYTARDVIFYDLLLALFIFIYSIFINRKIICDNSIFMRIKRLFLLSYLTQTIYVAVIFLFAINYDLRNHRIYFASVYGPFFSFFAICCFFFQIKLWRRMERLHTSAIHAVAQRGELRIGPSYRHTLSLTVTPDNGVPIETTAHIAPWEVKRLDVFSDRIPIVYLSESPEKPIIQYPDAAPLKYPMLHVGIIWAFTVLFVAFNTIYYLVMNAY